MRLSNSTVFLTGTTGLIGGELARALVRSPVRRLWAMARAGADGALDERFKHRFGSNGDGLEAFGSLLHPVSGDLTQPGLGLSPSAAATIAREVDCIIHCAGETSFLRQQACRRANVLGMQHLLSFARGCECQPLLVYVSTAASCGKVTGGCIPENEACPGNTEHHNEYTRTKAEAEQLLRASGLPAVIVRPSIVLSAGLPQKRFAMNILWCLPVLNFLGAAPVNSDSRLDIVTVQFVVESLLKLLQLPQRRYSCYHLSAGLAGAIAFGQVAGFLNEFYQRAEPLELAPPDARGRPGDRCPWQTPRQRAAAARLRPYLPFINMDTVFDNSRLVSDLGVAMPQNPNLLSYLGGLLCQFTLQDALAAARNP